MKIKKAIEMIDEYLLEPNNIQKDWVEVLKICRCLLVENKNRDNTVYGGTGKSNECWSTEE